MDKFRYTATLGTHTNFQDALLQYMILQYMILQILQMQLQMQLMWVLNRCT